MARFFKNSLLVGSLSFLAFGRAVCAQPPSRAPVERISVSDEHCWRALISLEPQVGYSVSSGWGSVNEPAPAADQKSYSVTQLLNLFDHQSELLMKELRMNALITRTGVVLQRRGRSAQTFEEISFSEALEGIHLRVLERGALARGNPDLARVFLFLVGKTHFEIFEISHSGAKPQPVSVLNLFSSSQLANVKVFPWRIVLNSSSEASRETVNLAEKSYQVVLESPHHPLLQSRSSVVLTSSQLKTLAQHFSWEKSEAGSGGEWQGRFFDVQGWDPHLVTERWERQADQVLNSEESASRLSYKEIYEHLVERVAEEFSARSKTSRFQKAPMKAGDSEPLTFKEDPHRVVSAFSLVVKELEGLTPHVVGLSWRDSFAQRLSEISDGDLSLEDYHEKTPAYVGATRLLVKSQKTAEQLLLVFGQHRPLLHKLR